MTKCVKIVVIRLKKCITQHRLAASQRRSLLRITTTEADGTVLTSTADCPRMELGMYYTMNFDYASLAPYMRFEAMTINDWQEGWTISGEILNPTNK